MAFNIAFMYTPAVCILFMLSWKIAHRLRLRNVLSAIPGPESQGWKKMGNLSQLYSPLSENFLHDLERFGSTIIKLHGYFWDIQLYVFDPLGVKQVVNDINTFPPTELFIQANQMMFGGGLLAAIGKHHSRQRKMLHPAFSNESLKLMAAVFFDTAHKMRENIQEKLESAPHDSAEIDMLHLASRGALESIGRAGLGYSFDSFTDSPNPYSQALQVLVPTVFGMFWIRQALVYIFDYIPSTVSRTLIKLVPWNKLQLVRKLVASLDTMAREVYTNLLTDLPKDGNYTIQDIQGRDVISILIRENLKALPEDRLSEADIRAQVATLLFAATDTTAVAVSRILHTLSEFPNTQAILREELIQARQGHELSYDVIKSLPYLDAICKETLRLYPPLPFTTRTTKKDTVITLSKPLPGCKTTEVFIPSNTNIVVGIFPFNRNPEVWGKDAHLWKPERWMKLPDTVHDSNRAGIYANTMTFYGGGKSCIGYKFAEMEIKIVLSVLISTFAFGISEQNILWRMQGLQKPTVEGASSPQMPLVVSLL